MNCRFPAILVIFACVVAPLHAQGTKITIKAGGPCEVEVQKDLVYREGTEADAAKRTLDLYLPKGQKDFPVLIFIHGGTWKSGDKKMYVPLGRLFAQNGVGTAIVNYRLSDKTYQAKHPDHIEDVAAAFSWVHANIAERGGNLAQIFVSGHSAGGHLASLLAVDESHLKKHKLTTDKIKGVISISGVYNITTDKVFNTAFGTDAELCKKASPLEYVRKGLMPFLIVYAEDDLPTLDTMAVTMGKKLDECDCVACVLKMKECNHITIIVKLASDEADQTTQAMLKFIAEHSNLKLKDKQVTRDNE